MNELMIDCPSCGRVTAQSHPQQAKHDMHIETTDRDAFGKKLSSMRRAGVDLRMVSLHGLTVIEVRDMPEGIAKLVASDGTVVQTFNL